MKVELESMHLQVKNNLLKLIFNQNSLQIPTTLFFLSHHYGYFSTKPVLLKLYKM